MVWVLYLTYDGLTDPLGHSQIIPYLLKLSSDYHIVVISFEKKKSFLAYGTKIKSLLERYHIFWHPMIYTKNPPVISTVYDLFRMYFSAKILIKKFDFKLIHARSYISAIVALYFKKFYRVSFLFDMRGFWADERVEGKLWNLKNPLFWLIYKLFKKLEVDFFSSSDFVVTLTNASIKHIIKLQRTNVPIGVIPCCVDLDLYSRENVDENKIQNFRQKFDLSENDCILSYMGSIGTWYCFEQTLRLFYFGKKEGVFQRLLVITTLSADYVLSLSQKYGINLSDVIVLNAIREQIPMYLSLSHIHNFFIKPTFSKVASSPTRFAEALAMELPIITNKGVGDIAEHIEKYQAGIVLDNFSIESFDIAIKKIPYLLKNKHLCRKLAIDIYNLDLGALRYKEIYRMIT